MFPECIYWINNKYTTTKFDTQSNMCISGTPFIIDYDIEIIKQLYPHLFFP